MPSIEGQHHGSQQCLDALAHAHLNQPYEAALATQGRRKRERADEDDTLSRWLDSAAAFCKVVSVLDEEAMNTGAWPGHHHKGREIQPDGRAFLRAAGAAAAAFEAGARAYVGVLSQNRRNFRHPSSSPATSASRSIILPSLWKV